MNALKKVSKDAGVHEKTVQAVARGEVKPARRRKKVQREQHFEVTTETVDQQVWATALKLAGGDVHRIRRVSDTAVVVENNPIKKK